MADDTFDFIVKKIEQVTDTVSEVASVESKITAKKEEFKKLIEEVLTEKGVI
jgi:hypothetical protein